MSKYIFCIDESFHDRKISKKSLISNEFFTPYVCAGIGFISNQLNNVFNVYNRFENKYLKFFNVDELKSDIVSRNKYRYGLATFKDSDLDLYSDYFDILTDNNIIYYISILDKIEYLILQCKYDFGRILNQRGCIYTITKSINIYKPEEVVNAILNKDNSFIFKLKKFYDEQILLNGDLELKYTENKAFSECSKYLADIDPSDINFDFTYDFIFEGLIKLLNEMDINQDDVDLFLDEEGSEKFYKSSVNNGFIQAISINSKCCQGVRISDLLAGFVSRFMRAIYLDTYNDPTVPYNKPHHLSYKWFEIDEKRFDLYKKIAKYFIEYSKYVFSTYISIYFDLFAEMIGLLYYFNAYDSFTDYCKIDACKHFEEATLQIIKRINSYQLDL